MNQITPPPPKKKKKSRFGPIHGFMFLFRKKYFKKNAASNRKAETLLCCSNHISTLEAPFPQALGHLTWDILHRTSPSLASANHPHLDATICSSFRIGKMAIQAAHECSSRYAPARSKVPSLFAMHVGCTCLYFLPLLR